MATREVTSETHPHPARKSAPSSKPLGRPSNQVLLDREKENTQAERDRATKLQQELDALRSSIESMLIEADAPISEEVAEVLSKHGVKVPVLNMEVCIFLPIPASPITWYSKDDGDPLVSVSPSTELLALLRESVDKMAHLLETNGAAGIKPLIEVRDRK
jgi:hypothetical protein